MVDDPGRIVAAGYDRIADEYARLEEGVEWPRLRRLKALLESLEAGSHVLDIGCGNGIPALREITTRNHRAVGVDVSARQVELARVNVPRARVIHADVRELHFGPASFDVIVSFYALDQIPREQHEAELSRWRGWLRPGGRVEDGQTGGSGVPGRGASAVR